MGGILGGILGGGHIRGAFLPVKHHHKPGLQNLERKTAPGFITGIRNTFKARAEALHVLRMQPRV